MPRQPATALFSACVRPLTSLSAQTLPLVKGGPKHKLGVALKLGAFFGTAASLPIIAITYQKYVSRPPWASADGADLIFVTLGSSKRLAPNLL